MSPICSSPGSPGLAVTLFLIGAGLTRQVLGNVGFRPLLQGVTLWLLVSSLTLAALLFVGLSSSPVRLIRSF